MANALEPARPFWLELARYGAQIALVDGATGEHWSYRDLAERVTCCAEQMPALARCLVLLFPDRDLAGLVCYLGALCAGHAVYLSPIELRHPAAASIIERFRPELILWKGEASDVARIGGYTRLHTLAGYNAALRSRCDDAPPHRDLCILLSTSASSGAPKAVRLSTRGLAANAAQIAHALRMSGADHAITNLPYGYIYGLSVVNSHLHVGASMTLERRSAADRAFWQSAANSRATTIAGVSLTYDYLRAIRWNEEEPPALRKILHSGDRISQETLGWLHANQVLKGSEMYLMYGQTEASGRMTVLPPELFSVENPSVGLPVRDGRVEIDTQGQIIFYGPNVMLGYATTRSDLTQGDVMQGVLPTEDLGYVGSDGLLYLTGRMSRRRKLFGRLIDLEAVESHFQDLCPVAAVARDDRIWVFCEGRADVLRSRALSCALSLGIPPQSLLLRTVGALPRATNGKIAYMALEAAIAH